MRLGPPRLRAAGVMRYRVPPVSETFCCFLVVVVCLCFCCYAVSGTTGFRNVLLLNGRGRELAYLSTRGTPQTVTFDHRGTRLATGTASGYVYVVDLPSAGPGSLTY